MSFNSKGIVIVSLLIASLFISCSKKSYYQIQGATMGTYYHITFESERSKGVQEAIDEALIAVNNSLSTYIPQSTISRINKASEPIEVDSFFEEVFIAAKEVFKQTNGAFDPTVMPLVNAWGFGFDTLNHVDSLVIDSLMNYVGFDKVKLHDGKIIKDNPNIMLDFSAIAKGYGVDVIAELLESFGIENYMVEVGGEVRVKGLNPKSIAWRVAIEQPIDNKTKSQVFDKYVSLSNKSIATSGNYRNFYMKQGNKIAHTINPKTGYPIINDLLSATVLHDKCMIADAYATAFMVLGSEKSIIVLDKLESLMTYLISREEDNEYCTYGLLDMIQLISE
ncbi:MAG: FAD:protein FMN transferase [Cytophagia bacterium]|nr:FAD:protein FMN transferase [Cytophagia bacterium]